ncbi:putative reverse transcriptase domain-containing protein [Tanacetum coccineum]
MAPMTRRGPNTPVNNTNPNNVTPESIQAMIDQALLLNYTNGDGSHRGGTEGVVGLTRWIEKMESVFNIIGCAIENQVKFATCTLLGAAFALTWGNGYIRTLGPEAYTMTWEVLKKKMTKQVLSARPKMLDETIELANDLMDQKLIRHLRRKGNHENKKKADGYHPETTMDDQTYNMGTGKKKPYGRSLAKCTKCHLPTMARAPRSATTPKGNGCFECGAPGHLKRDCPKLKNKDGGNGNAQGWVYAGGNAEKRGNASGNPDANVVTENSYDVELTDGKIVEINTIIRGCTLNYLDHPFNIDLMPVELGSFDVITGMDWLRRCHAVIVCDEKLVQVPYGNETLTFCGNESSNGRKSRLTVISCSKAQEYMAKGCQVFLAQISAKKEEDKSEGKQIKDVPIVRDFLKVFPKDLPSLPPARPVEFQIDLIPRAAPVA